MSQPLHCEFTGGVARLTLSGADAGHVLSRKLLEGLIEALTRAGADDACRAIVITADGRTFCAGMDFDMFLENQLPEPDYFLMFAECLKLIHQSSRPVIAGVNGEAMGGGVGLVAACDWVVATQDASFMLPEVVVGMIPAVITPFLGRRLSPAAIRGLTLSSRRVDAAEANRIGLVDEIADSGLDATVEPLVRRLLRSSPDALAASKAYVENTLAGDLDQQVDAALEQVTTWLERPEVIEGIRCFAEGLSPPWFSATKVKKDV